MKIIIHHRYKSFISVLKIFKMDLADSGNKLYKCTLNLSHVVSKQNLLIVWVTVFEYSKLKTNFKILIFKLCLVKIILHFDSVVDNVKLCQRIMKPHTKRDIFLHWRTRHRRTHHKRERDKNLRKINANPIAIASIFLFSFLFDIRNELNRRTVFIVMFNYDRVWRCYCNTSMKI